MEPYSYWMTIGPALFIGLAFCFYGYCVFRILCSIVWTLTGFFVGVSFLPEAPNVALLLGGVLACGGAYLGYRFYLFSVFLVGLLAGLTIGEFFFDPASDINNIYFLLGTGLLGGAICVRMQKPLIISSTSWKGAWILILTWKMFQLGPEGFEKVFQGSTGGPWMGIWQLAKVYDVRSIVLLGLFFLLGYFVQSRYTSKESKKDESKKDESKKE